MLKIAVSGGAAAGKTTLARQYAAADPTNVELIGEVAGELLLAQALSQRRMSPKQRRDLQVRIYAEQLRREGAATSRALLLTDRGTVDGGAYWPDGPARFWQALDTSHERELLRYDAVVYLERASNYFTNTPWRTETAEAALRVERRLRALWRQHPRFHCIPVCTRFEDKAAQFSRVVDCIVGAR